MTRSQTCTPCIGRQSLYHWTTREVPISSIFYDYIHISRMLGKEWDGKRILYIVMSTIIRGFPDGSDSKESASNAGHPGSIPGLVRSPGEGNGYPLQYSCLENSMVRGAWWATVHGVTKSWTRLSDLTFSLFTIFKIYYVPCIVLSTLYLYLNIPRCVLQSGF